MDFESEIFLEFSSRKQPLLDQSLSIEMSSESKIRIPSKFAVDYYFRRVEKETDMSAEGANIPS